MADGDVLLGLSQRARPENCRAEQAILGAMLANNRAYERVAEFLEPTHFAYPEHGRIYERIAERILDGRIADAVAMKADFEGAGILESVGGVGYLAELLASMISLNSVAEYGRAVVDAWKRRQLIAIGENIVNEAFGAGAPGDADVQIGRAEKALGEISASGDRRSRLLTVGDAIRAAVDQAMEAYRTGKPPGVVFGMPTVDRALDGLLAPGTLTLLAGLPGSGKTALAAQMGLALGKRAAAEAMEAGATPPQAARAPGMLLISMEMSAEEIGLRLAALEADLTIKRVRDGNLDIAATLNLSRAMDRTRDLPFRVHDMLGLPYRLAVPKIVMHLQKQAERIVVFDHLLVMGDDEDTGKGRGPGLDASGVAWMTRNLKKLARRLQIPIIALTHTPRPKEGIQRRPISSDVKWAGEGDADNVVFVHRPIMTMPDSPPPRGRLTDEKYRGPDGPLTRWENERKAAAKIVEIVVTKARMGAGGVYRMRWDGPTTSVREWVDEPLMAVPEDFDSQ